MGEPAGREFLAAALLALAPACSGATVGIGGDGGGTDGNVADARLSDAPGLDVPAPPPACALAKPFGPPTALPMALVQPSVLDPRLSPDELTLYFSAYDPSSATSTPTLYVETRATTADSFGGPVVLQQAGWPSSNYAPTVSDDGLTLVFEALASGGPPLLYGATRPSPSAAFGTPAQIGTGGTPYLTPSAGSLYYADAAMGGPALLYRAPLNGLTLLPRVTITELNLTMFQELPVVTADELTIYFAAKPGALIQAYVATRGSSGGVFGTPAPLAQVNGTANAAPSWVSRDGCRLYLQQWGVAANAPRQALIASRPAQ